MMFWAASGVPGYPSVKLVVRSGWPPAWEVDIVVSKASIGSEAEAGGSERQADATPSL